MLKMRGERQDKQSSHFVFSSRLYRLRSKLFTFVFVPPRLLARVSPSFSSLSLTFILSILRRKRKDEIRRAAKLEWRRENAKNLRLHHAPSLRKFPPLPLELPSSSPSFYQRTAISLLSRVLVPRTLPLFVPRKSTRARPSGPPSFPSLRNPLPPPPPSCPSRPTSLVLPLLFIPRPWRPRG